MNRYAPIFLFATLAAPALADIAPPSSAPVRHEVWFEGLDDPALEGRRFYLYHCYPLNRPLVEVRPGEPVLGMTNCSPSLYAVAAGEPPTGEEALRDFLHGPGCAGSGRIEFVNYVSKVDATRKVVTVYRVRLDGTTLHLEKVREDFLDADGKPVGPFGRPPVRFALAGVSVAAFAGLGVLAIRRRRRR